MAKSLYQMLAELTSEVESTNKSHFKQAAEVGKTTHPVDKLDSGSKPASVGTFGSEQAADVAAQQPQLLEGKGELSYSQDDAADKTNIRKSEIGDDASQEKNYKMTSYDPGTTHPARVDRGGKEAHAKYASASMSDLYAANSLLCNAILADLANGQKPVKQASDASPAANKLDLDKLVKEAAETQKTSQPAFAEGYELAASLGIEKAAAEAHVAQYVEKLAADAAADAELVAAFLNSNAKSAGAESFSEEGAEHTGAPAASEPSKEPAADAESAPKEEAPAMDAVAGTGAEESMGEDEALAALDQALQELDISPEELAAAITESQGEAGGDMGGMPPLGGDPAAMGGMPPEGMPPEGMPPEGMPPEAAGGMPPEAAGGMDPAAMGGMPPDVGMKLAVDIYRFRRNHAKQASAAKQSSTKKAVANKNLMKSYVLELFK